jgi:hypothetical protein
MNRVFRTEPGHHVSNNGCHSRSVALQRIAAGWMGSPTRETPWTRHRASSMPSSPAGRIVANWRHRRGLHPGKPLGDALWAPAGCARKAGQTGVKRLVDRGKSRRHGTPQNKANWRTVIATVVFALGPMPSMGAPPELFPPGFGYTLPQVYLLWFAVVWIMYPACRWYG